MANKIDIEYVVGQTITSCSIAVGSTIRDVVGDIEDAVGVFGKLRTLDHILEDGDRIEIYRPLHLDPKEARRHRAAGKFAGRHSVDK